MPDAKPIRPLLIAEGANPTLTSASLVGWSCARAIAQVTDAHIVTEWRNRDDFLKAGLVEGQDFTAIDIRRIQNLAWRTTKLLSRGEHFSWSLYAIFSNLVYPFFEREVWKQFAGRLKAGEFDLVHRILPLSPTTPSWISKRLQEIGVPWVLGPLNGGVPWPHGFDDVRKLENDGAGRLRALYRLQPGVQRTRRDAQAIITAARTTLREMPEPLHTQCVFIPENAIDAQRFDLAPSLPRSPGPLQAAFVGRLVALKGVDMLINAAAPLVREGKLRLDIIGDGPERERLQSLVQQEGIQSGVRMEGWVDHSVLQPRLRESHVLAFPSIREFGGGAVLEAMALGVPPIVLDHGGPPELVPPTAGFVLPLESRPQIVRDLGALLARLAEAPEQLAPYSAAAQAHIRRFYTWEAKAQQMLEVYRWVLGQRPDKPTWGIPMGFE
ncbi:Glycosyltransferase involved in cell wall bisynthesis [Prosthecobacter debontii]|uniref:Glycosyltransferase involved in cell wall bisynthesis n=1 Tax=Prosthecobacter debontii TaxID=48467 RepID=A0A1T4XVK0_9BACT|nr:glycosyltransferase family 4 protein [Prosthecobacter debontii]SKA93085.1 Glycosyltransferase involved in cell wall bisynthesis [Prosthecobacter debontii]